METSSNDREKTTFCNTEGLYEFNVMHFGLCTGPTTFQRQMTSLMAGVQCSSCLYNYLDDIGILGKTLQDHLKHLSQKVKKYYVSLNLK